MTCNCGRCKAMRRQRQDERAAEDHRLADEAVWLDEQIAESRKSDLERMVERAA